MADEVHWDNNPHTPLIAEFRANHGRVTSGFHGSVVLLLHTVGTRTGRPLVTLMDYVPIDGSYVVCVPKVGTDKCPDWYHGLLATPDTRIEIGDDIVSVHATELDSVARDAFHAEHSGWLEYQRRMRQIIPVMALTPVDAEGTPR